ncbi:unnamed protein product [Phyllotreta striolata]|uniref:U2A'/phosphoprotein 32 family A C-terminal domain-containing protein n=1 Tax=Phyllotreta striolata TaxID=444603 RepID=A0A9N9TT34_PHYSR|nr:unnamed protein product [Phyllotreta striolata]
MSKRLTEEMVIARTKCSDLSQVKRINCWGSELIDVSLLRKMPSLEVVALSINKINSLADFQFCTLLEELYVRQNDIRDLCQVMYLQCLPNLKNLWLEQNPCSSVDGYRLAVLRALPQLQKLDNVQVTAEERKEAQRRGKALIHPEDSQEESEDEYASSPQHRVVRSREQYSETESSPLRQSPIPSARDETTDYEELEENEDHYLKDNGSDANHALSPTRQSPPPLRDANRRNYSPELGYADKRQVKYERESPPRHHQQQQYYEKSSPTNNASFEEPVTETTNFKETKLVNSQSANCIKEYSNGEKYTPSYSGSEYSVPHAVERKERYGCPASAHRPPFARRPVTRNSNILSAVLCLVKELDYPSLEVVDMAIRCRMDELVE